jgi:hypothetical protein
VNDGPERAGVIPELRRACPDRVRAAMAIERVPRRGAGGGVSMNARGRGFSPGAALGRGSSAHRETWAALVAFDPPLRRPETAQWHRKPGGATLVCKSLPTACRIGGLEAANH